MIFKTQRSLADISFENVKLAVKSSGLDYILQETAYSANLKIRKKYLTDYSSTHLLSQAASTSVITQMFTHFHFPRPVQIILKHKLKKNVKIAEFLIVLNVHKTAKNFRMYNRNLSKQS